MPPSISDIPLADIRSAFLESATNSNPPVEDPVLGTRFSLKPVETELLALPAFQRLSHIGQMEARFVSHGASLTHTRYEHSIGTCYWADQIAQRVGLDHGDTTTARAAALVHDLFHLPFSHTLNGLGVSILGHDHDEGHRDLFAESGVSDVLIRHGVSPEAVARALETTGKDPRSLGNLAKGVADRIDYVVRDISHSGAHPLVKQQVLELARTCLQKMTLVDGVPCFEQEALPVMTEFARFRAYLFADLAAHPKSRVFCSMLYRAVRDTLRQAESEAPPSEFAAFRNSIRGMTDAGLLEALRERNARPILAESGFVDDLIEPVFAIRFSDLSADAQRELIQNGDRFTSIVQGALTRIGIPYGEHFVTLPPLHFLKPIPVPVQSTENAVQICQVGGECLPEYTFAGVFVRREHTDRIDDCVHAIRGGLAMDSKLAGLATKDNLSAAIDGPFVTELYSPGPVQ